MNTIMAPPPPGFMLFPMGEPPGFAGSCGEIWMKADQGKLVWGFRVQPIHANPNGTCHGGMLATFCDMHMGLAAQFEHPFEAMLLPTVTLSLDYLAPTRLGAWVEARSQIIKVTRSLVFTDEVVFGDGEAVAHARGIYKIPSAPVGADAQLGPGIAARLRRRLGSDPEAAARG